MPKILDVEQDLQGPAISGSVVGQNYPVTRLQNMGDAMGSITDVLTSLSKDALKKAEDVALGTDIANARELLSTVQNPAENIVQRDKFMNKILKVRGASAFGVADAALKEVAYTWDTEADGTVVITDRNKNVVSRMDGPDTEYRNRLRSELVNFSDQYPNTSKIGEEVRKLAQANGIPIEGATIQQFAQAVNGTLYDLDRGYDALITMSNSSRFNGMTVDAKNKYAENVKQRVVGGISTAMSTLLGDGATQVIANGKLRPDIYAPLLDAYIKEVMQNLNQRDAFNRLNINAPEMWKNLIDVRTSILAAHEAAFKNDNALARHNKEKATLMLETMKSKDEFNALVNNPEARRLLASAGVADAAVKAANATLLGATMAESQVTGVAASGRRILAIVSEHGVAFAYNRMLQAPNRKIMNDSDLAAVIDDTTSILSAQSGGLFIKDVEAFWERHKAAIEKLQKLPESKFNAEGIYRDLTEKRKQFERSIKANGYTQAEMDEARRVMDNISVMLKPLSGAQRRRNAPATVEPDAAKGPSRARPPLAQ